MAVQPGISHGEGGEGLFRAPPFVEVEVKVEPRTEVVGGERRGVVDVIGSAHNPVNQILAAAIVHLCVQFDDSGFQPVAQTQVCALFGSQIDVALLRGTFVVPFREGRQAERAVEGEIESTVENGIPLPRKQFYPKDVSLSKRI